jgi:CIC family chloride channel protein
LRQLILCERDGLPVLSVDGTQVEGWITNSSAMHAIARSLGAATAESSRVRLEAGLAASCQDARSAARSNPLAGFHVAEILIDEHSPACGRTLGSVTWPAGHVPVSLVHRRVLHEADPELTLAPGDRVNLLIHVRSDGEEDRGSRDARAAETV